MNQDAPSTVAISFCSNSFTVYKENCLDLFLIQQVYSELL